MKKPQATNWREIQVPSFCERLLGFSVPQQDQVLVVSYEGMHLLQLGEFITVETNPDYCEYDLYDPETGICHYLEKDWSIIGLYGGKPILNGINGEKLVLNDADQTLSIVKGLWGMRRLWYYNYSNFSGDWAATTFSPNGRFLVLGCPYDFDFRIWERVTFETG